MQRLILVAGLAFAASANKRTIYTLEVNNLGDWAVIRRSGYNYPGPNHPHENEEREEIDEWTGALRPPANPFDGWNVLRAEVEGDHVKLYVNGERKVTLTLDDVSSLRNVGIFGGDWEITPTRISFDYFFVDEGCDTY